MSDFVVWSRGDGSTVSWNSSHFSCSCRDCRSRGSQGSCVHVQTVLRQRLDASVVQKFLEESLKEKHFVRINLPLFLIDEGRHIFYYPSRFAKLQNGRGWEVMMGYSCTEAIDLPGTRNLAGAKYFDVGVFFPGDGLKSIVSGVSAWAATQLAINSDLECDSFLHGANGPAKISEPEKTNLTSILLTGECLACDAARRGINDDIPVF